MPRWKIEPPGGDALAHSNPAWYEALASGQEVIRLDLKDAIDRNRLDELLAEANVLLAVAAPEEHFWKNLLPELGLEVTREDLAEVFSHKTAKEWEEWAQQRDLPLKAVSHQLSAKRWWSAYRKEMTKRDEQKLRCKDRGASARR